MLENTTWKLTISQEFMAQIQTGKLPVAGKGMVTILGGVSLGPRERAVVLQVGDARLLVGVAPGRVQTLHVIEGSHDQITEASGAAFDSRLRTEMEANPL